MLVPRLRVCASATRARLSTVRAVVLPSAIPLGQHPLLVLCGTSMSSQMKLVGVHRRVATLPAPHTLESSMHSSTALELHAHGPVSATRRFLRLLLRAASLGLLLLPPLLLLLPVLFLDDADGSWQARFERALLGALDRGGPCLTKLGQWASTRPDVLPPSLCATLSSLHHRVRPHSLAHTRAAIAEAFGVPSEELFGELSAEPVGSGCIAQVHRATTRDGTMPLAIKVLHPRVEAIVAEDLFLLRGAAHALELLLVPFVRGLRWLALTEALDEFAGFMERQLDLRHEARNLDIFRANFAKEERVLIPRPVRELTFLGIEEGIEEGMEDGIEEGRGGSGNQGGGIGGRIGGGASGGRGLVSRRVLVETYLPGMTMSSLLLEDSAATADEAEALAEAEEAASAAMQAAAMGATSQEDARAAVARASNLEDAARRRTARNAELARLGLTTFLKMLLRHNFVHADLHPGNILVTGNGVAGDGVAGDGVAEDGTVSAPLRLGIIDAGLVVELSERDRRNFLALFKAIGDGDGARAGELMLTHAREQRCDDPAAFKAGMKRLVASARAGERGAFNLSNLRIGDVLLEVTDLVRTHRVQADPSFTTLVCAIVVLEGLGRQLDPTLDLFSVALPLLAGIG